eukprot:TRINITY_DN12712_c0_g1_i1.p1 TRINITY_DN12712_c0_g1~~TRINITY_DN12712_c0_g1_i1.p1  ORF type:complete len:201 (+),score=38.35 TRINITY_DN12712_c0_g1_i1:16-618(+)
MASQDQEQEDFSIYDDVTIDVNQNVDDEIYLKSENNEYDEEVINPDHQPPKDKTDPAPPKPDPPHTRNGAPPKRPRNPIPSRTEEDSDEDQKVPKNTEGVVALCLSNLTWWTTDQQIEEIFSIYGKIQKIRFVEDKTNGKSKGQCFVSYENPENAAKVTQKMKEMYVKLISYNKTIYSTSQNTTALLISCCYVRCSYFYS